MSSVVSLKDFLCVLPTCMSVHHMYILHAHIKRALDPLELELHMVGKLLGLPEQ